nr:putative nucleotide-diphospho-sugar transferase [Ipomoea batatas]
MIIRTGMDLGLIFWVEIEIFWDIRTEIDLGLIFWAEMETCRAENEVFRAENGDFSRLSDHIKQTTKNLQAKPLPRSTSLSAADMDCGKILRVTDYAHYLVCTLLFFGAFSFILIISTNPNQSMNPLSLFHGQNPPCLPSQPTTEKHRLKMYRDKLEEALAGASTENNKTVIIAVVNKAYVDGDKSMLDMFLDGFWLGTDDVDFAGGKVFMSLDFLDMMWRRTQFLGDVLKLGYSFIFTDTDVIWLRNPFPRLRDLNETLDLQISTDNFNGDDRRNQTRSTPASIWFDPTIEPSRCSIPGLKVKFLNTKFFSGFCQDSGDVKSVVTVHANCCRTITAKLADLMAVIHDWQRFKSFSGDANQTAAFHWSPHDRCMDSWNH